MFRPTRSNRARAVVVLLLSGLAMSGCDVETGTGAAGIAAPWPTPGPGPPSGDDALRYPLDRLQPHGAGILPGMSLHAVYIGDLDVDGVASRDDFLSWVLGSGDYWSVLGQYGVGNGLLAASDRVPTASFFTPDAVVSGSVTQDALASRVLAYVLNGADADAYIFFMPTTVGITEMDGGARASCSVFGGYHSWIFLPQGSSLPYAVIPPCPAFPHDMPVSHELAEMATDPTFNGWYSNQDGEEVGDLCNFPVSQPIDLWSPTRLWSNADGACVPP
jgi:hypothetical protein